MIMDKVKNSRFNEQFYLWSVIVLMLVYAVIGAIFYDDYGCGPDEGMERQTALVNFRYAVHKLHIPISQKNETWLAYLPELHDYRDRYYGTALHFPLVIIESLTNFTLEPIQFYGLRHVYTFITWYFSLICLYKLITNRFGSRKYGLAAILLMILTPRFFAESFYNNKDLIFVSWYVICAWLTDLWFRKRNWKITVLLALAMALTCNTRFNGIIYPVIFIFLYFLEFLQNKKVSAEKQFVFTLVLSVIFFYLVTPNFWESPLQTLAETIQFNMHHPNHSAEGNLFKGYLVDASRTMTYIPVWIALTVPTVYLCFSLLGAFLYIVQMVRVFVSKSFSEIDRTDAMMFLGSFAAVIFIILAHVTVYNGWRHSYFAYPGFVYFAVYFLARLEMRRNRILSAGAFVLLFCSMLYNVWWIAANHPFEYVYFVPLIRDNAAQYSGDYWSLSSRALLEYITDSDPERMISINHAHSQAGSINRGLLPEEKRKYIELTYENKPDVDYYIVCRNEIPTVDIDLPGYEKVFSVKVDRDEIGAVFRKMKDE